MGQTTLPKRHLGLVLVMSMVPDITAAASVKFDKRPVRSALGGWRSVPTRHRTADKTLPR